MIKYYSIAHMMDKTLIQKRIRDSAPHRKSIALTEEDIQRLSYLETQFSSLYPGEVPFSFSKTISKAVELAFLQVLSQKEFPIQQSLTGLPADPEALQLRLEQRLQSPGQQKPGQKPVNSEKKRSPIGNRKGRR